MSKIEFPGGAWTLFYFSEYTSLTQSFGLPILYFFVHQTDIYRDLAWRIPGTTEPGGLPSMGSHKVGHDWSNLAAAAAAVCSKNDVRLQKRLSHGLFSGETHSVVWRHAWAQLVQVLRSKCYGCHMYEGKGAAPSVWERFVLVSV